jgi:uncharacterized membrane protein
MKQETDARHSRGAGSPSTDQSLVSIEDAEWANPKNWHGGVLNLYFSKRDTRPFVPKRGTVVGGATINFARPAGIGFMVGALLFIILMFVLNRTDWLTR